MKQVKKLLALLLLFALALTLPTAAPSRPLSALRASV